MDPGRGAGNQCSTGIGQLIDQEVRRALEELLQGRSFATGQFTLVVDGAATSTTIVRTGTSSNSIINYMAIGATASMADITRIVPAKDSFTIFHSASATTRTFYYSWVTGVAT